MYSKGILYSLCSLFMTSLWSHALLPQLAQGEPLSKYIPPSWRTACVVGLSPLIDPTSPSATSTTTANPMFLNESLRVPSIKHDIPAGSTFVSVTCQVPNSDSYQWKFMDLRKWQLLTKINRDTTPVNRTVNYIINVHCSNGANISLPWPMKTEGVLEMHADNCGLTDRDALFQDSMVYEVANELRKLELRNCISIVDVLSISDILQQSQGDSINITKALDCGHDSTLEVLIRSNFTLMSLEEFRVFRQLHILPVNETDVSLEVGNGKLPSDQYVKPEDRLVTDSQSLISDHTGIRGFDLESMLTDNLTSSTDFNNSFPLPGLKVMAESDILEFMRKITNTHSECKYEKLTFQDESMTSDSFKDLLQFLAFGSQYPVLKVMNYSMVGLARVPRGLQQWKLFFPSLRYVDLSSNNISEVKGEDFAYSSYGPAPVFNVRHNNITTLTMEVLDSWLAGGNAFIDARDNPIRCDCNMKSLIPALQNASFFTGKLKEYEYVKQLTCHSPPDLQGRQLQTLSVSSLSCPSFESQTGWIIALSIVLAFFVFTTLVLFRYKAEIRILLYTRLSIRLPWDVDSLRQGKTYDAFVSYSNEDAKWVYQNIAALLESPTAVSNGKSQQNSLETNSIGTNNNNNNINDNKDSKKSSASKRKYSISSAGSQFKLCLHQRDFIPGVTIMDNIMESIEASRHTIVVMSPNFMRSEWAMEELRQAYRQSLVEKTRHLIVVLLEKISEADMDPLIKRCCKTFTYLDASDGIFKDRLVFSLTTKDRGAKRRDRYAQKESQSQDIESNSNCYDNQTYEVVDRPCPPARELSNMSSSSNTELAGSFYQN